MSAPDLRNPVHLLAFGFGSGLAPWAPGTFGTLVAIPLWWGLAQTPWWCYGAVTLLVALVGVPLCGRTATDLGVHDHSGIVWDEIAGFLVTMAGAPVSLFSALGGFLLFRLFDIAKPWPIGWLDRRVKGGAGIMIDDLVAGLYAALLLQLGPAFL